MSIGHMVNQYLHDTGTHKNVKITSSEYTAWSSGFLFDALKHQRYGQSFCNKFDIRDNILFYTNQVEFADRYIKKNYVE
jgi:hypothetical protein